MSQKFSSNSLVLPWSKRLKLKGCHRCPPWRSRFKQNGTSIDYLPKGPHRMIHIMLNPWYPWNPRDKIFWRPTHPNVPQNVGTGTPQISQIFPLFYGFAYHFHHFHSCSLNHHSPCLSHSWLMDVYSLKNTVMWISSMVILPMDCHHLRIISMAIPSGKLT